MSAQPASARSQQAPQAFRWSLLLSAFAGAVVSVVLGAYGDWHRPTGVPVFSFGFPTLLSMKSWFTTGAALFGVVQIVTAAGMWGRLPGVRLPPAWLASVHRWSGAMAFVSILPVAYHCLWSLGYQTFSARVAVHSALGCAFFGVFTTKMLVLRISSAPSVVLPLLGGGLFGVLAALWATSSLWFFTQGS